ncbi:hypothetical protein H8F01_13990 [Dyella telluris]|uniref:Uncharacterized protein n=2 Tax=Dyella telluris TaxID=2763498 RepID=A0A7G8QAM5_9GAMM|nr:hypothetical protein H8F01_13990 [Dyella telluris]
MRWRTTPPQPGRRWLALGIVLALHVLFGWFTWHEMQVQKARERERDDRQGALQVRLIQPATTPAGPAAPPELVPPPPPEAAAPRPASRPVVHEPPAKNAMTVNLPPEPPAPATSTPSAAPPKLYDPAGQAVLPATASTTPTAPGPDYVQRTPQGDAKIMQHSTPVPYNATRFDKDWEKSSGNVVQDALKKAKDDTTVKHTFHVAPGVRIHCAISFAALAGGCGGDPPPAPSYKDRDMRLNMAPANQLAPGSPEPATISVDECIALYRADKPLPHGCPVDTPTRSVDAEMQERAAHPAGQDGH